MSQRESGQILIIAIIFLGIMILFSGAILGLSGQTVIATRNAMAKEQALELAEAGLEKAIWQLNQTAGAYTGELGSVLGAGTGEFDVAVANITGNKKEITATGYVPTKNNPRVVRIIKAEVSTNAANVSFNYGVQVGDGGLNMSNNSLVTGSVYSNGVIDGSNGARITGTAFSAGPAGRLTDSLQIDGDAYAHRIDNNVSVGGSAFGYEMDRLTVGGNVFTNSVSNCTVGGNVFYSSITGCSVGGSQNPGYPGESDPEPEEFPIPDSQILDWQNQAAAGGVITGNFSLTNGAQQSLGPKKITGDLTLSNGARLTLTGPVWVEGEIDISNNAIVALHSSYSDNSEVVISDSKIDVSNNAIFQRAGDDSYIIMITTSTSGDSFDVANNADALVVYAPNGGVDISNNAVLREVTAYQLDLSNNSEIIYESGLANINFNSGPGGSWGIERGTWRIVQ